MKHLENSVLIAYIDNGLSPGIRAEAETHLSICEQCQEAYLSLLLEQAPVMKVHPSQAFTGQVLAEARKIKESRKKHVVAQRKKAFGYYVVAASITLLLTYSGLFSSIEAQMPLITSEMLYTTSRAEEVLMSGWTEKLMNSTVNFMNRVDPIQGSENKNEN